MAKHSLKTLMMITSRLLRVNYLHCPSGERLLDHFPFPPPVTRPEMLLRAGDVVYVEEET